MLMVKLKATIIFQGPITDSLIDGLRKSIHAIKQEDLEIVIIISTWESCNVPCLGQDKTIKNKELPNFTPDGYKSNNLHRQILTTYEALKDIEDSVVVKLRTDIIISNPKLFLREILRTRDKGRVFGKKITTISYSSVDPLRNDLPLLYHPCDWVYIGDYKDIIKIFDCPMPNGEYFTAGLSIKGRASRLGNYAEGMRCEEYICSYSLNRNHWGGKRSYISPSLFSKIRSNRSIALDFYILSIEEIGLTSAKHKTNLFDPNRFDKLGNYLWASDYESKLIFIKYRTLIKIYYLQKYVFEIMRLVKNIAKHAAKHRH